MHEDDHVKKNAVGLPPDPERLDHGTLGLYPSESVEELARPASVDDKSVVSRALLPGKRFGSYHILDFIAAGGMGEIYAAQRINPDGSRSRPVALKVITPEHANDWRIVERFKREASISKAIRSKYVVRVYEFGESPQGHVFLAMELLRGEELFDRLHRERIFSPMKVAELSLQILKGLHHIHKSGFVHRDIKPENIFLATDPTTNQETIKILDFGISKRADVPSDPLLSVVGQIYGTPQYLAPEQAVDPDVDHRADLYSLGIVMYECVSGNLPFDCESAYSFVVAHQIEEIRPLPSTIDPEFADLIYRALIKDPDLRFQSAIEMGRAIKRWIDETSLVEEDEEYHDLKRASIRRDNDLLSLPRTKVGMPFPHNDASPNMVPIAGPDRILPRTKVGMPFPHNDASPNMVPIASPDRILPRTKVGMPFQHNDAAPNMVPIASPIQERRPSAPIQDHRPSAPIQDRRPSALSPVESSAPPPATNEVIAPSSTQLRPPSDSISTSAKNSRTVHTVTGVTIGLLILAILWVILL